MSLNTQITTQNSNLTIDKININDKNIADLFFLKTVKISYIPARNIKNKKNIKKYPPIRMKNIDRGNIIIDVKILF